MRIDDAVAYFRDPQVSIWSKLAGLFAVAYVVWPFDLIPDFIPVIGWLDDVGVVGLIVAFYIRQISDHRSRLLPASRPQLPAGTASVL